ncbi:MAG: hypothetical protein KBS44_04900, partial [Clostridiales bacterium]|nr:hypothetical protein [Candidatus Coliplasma equi]
GSEGGSGTFTNYGGNGGSGGKILYAGGTVTLQSEATPCISGGKCGYGCNNDPANVGADAVITVCGSPVMKSGENSKDANFAEGYNNENYFHVHYHADSDENCFCDVCGTFLGSDHIVISLGAQIKTETSSLRLGAFYNGIILDDEQREAVKDLGMIFYPKHLLGEDILDFNNTNAVRMSANAIIEFVEDQAFADYETFTFYVSIVGIPSNGYNTKIAFRPFIILGDNTIEYGEVMERCYNDVVNKQSQ